jgi:hypothetical protein
VPSATWLLPVLSLDLRKRRRVGRLLAAAAIAAVAQSFGYLSHRQAALAKAFGYANVAKVVLLLPDGVRVTTPTVAAGWPGSDVRLWQVSLPASAWKGGLPKITAVAYDTAGQVIGKEQLARPEI